MKIDFNFFLSIQMKQKKPISIILLLLCFGLSPLFSAPCGDVDSNGAINIIDALMTAQHYVNLNPENFDQSAADVSGDGLVDIIDALQLAQHYVGLINSFPGCTQPPTSGTETHELQAETEAFWNDSVVESDHSGYTGAGYVNTVNASGTWIEWRINVTVATNARCVFTYACATDARPMDLSVNSNRITALNFPATGVWTNWLKESAVVTLNAGMNTIRLTSINDGGAPNMDKMDITLDGTLVTLQPTLPPTPGPTIQPGSYDAVVALDGSGDYNNVKAAIDAAPNNGSSWYTIYIKKGTYRQRLDISSSKTYLRLLGEDAASTILTYNDASGTSQSATVFVRSKNFIAQNLTIENSYDYYSSPKQAVALDLQADRQIYLNCRITGHQDTLFTRGGGNSRQYFRDCIIVGCTDFVFGDATAIFNKCEIRSRKAGASTLTAPSTNSSAYGLVFLNCRLTTENSPSAKSTNLGRPWSTTGACHYLYCELGSHISAWTDMGGRPWENASFGEYKNTGPGARTGSDRPQMSDSEAAGYTLKNMLSGSDGWDPEKIIAGIN